MDKPENPLQALIPDLREIVKDELKEGYHPQDLAFALTYIATEMGLYYTDNSTTVFPVILRAMSQAVEARQAEDIESPCEDEIDLTEEVAPDGVTLH